MGTDVAMRRRRLERGEKRIARWPTDDDALARQQGVRHEGEIVFFFSLSLFKHLVRVLVNLDR